MASPKMGSARKAPARRRRKKTIGKRLRELRSKYIHHGDWPLRLAIGGIFGFIGFSRVAAPDQVPSALPPWLLMAAGIAALFGALCILAGGVPRYQIRLDLTRAGGFGLLLTSLIDLVDLGLHQHSANVIGIDGLGSAANPLLVQILLIGVAIHAIATGWPWPFYRKLTPPRPKPPPPLALPAPEPQPEPRFEPLDPQQTTESDKTPRGFRLD